MNSSEFLDQKAQRSAMIDVDHLQKYVAGDVALRDEILSIFNDQIETLRARIDVDADDESWTDVMHAMKGAARGVGAWDVGTLCEKAEQLVGADPEKQAERRELTQRLAGELDAMLDHARRLREDKGRLSA